MSYSIHVSLVTIGTAWRGENAPRRYEAPKRTLARPDRGKPPSLWPAVCEVVRLQRCDVTRPLMVDSFPEHKRPLFHALPALCH
ncbi:hypothetical protein E2C01_046345 [Portunus trituberculatus]|uniref:Uncharacterized protein n=1 Tax=Portunus trituberculatus TaxID=210409 RepID=A0A5B7G4Y9_PORTR|nr:hypothetical protein [Portunus trituberculatus]